MFPPQSPSPLPTFTLAEWLKGFNARCHKLDGVTATKLRGTWPFRERGERCPWAGKGEGTAKDASTLLQSVDMLAREEESEWKKHQAWLRGFDWKDYDAWRAIPQLLGVDRKELGPFDPQQSGDPEGDWLAECNRAARRRGHDGVVCELDTGGDDRLVVALPLAALTKLVADGYLTVTKRDLFGVEPPPGWRQMVRSLVKKLVDMT